MIKDTKKVKKSFSLNEQFEGKVKRLTLHFQDAPILKDQKDPKSVTGWYTVVFGTLQLFIEGNIKKVNNINFAFPLNVNKDLKNHIVAIIAEAVVKKSEEKK